MTRKQRAQVVELLRCAADLCEVECDGSGQVSNASRLLGCTVALRNRALRAERAVAYDFGSSWMRYYERIALLLEAAARVEEGSWP